MLQSPNSPTQPWTINSMFPGVGDLEIANTAAEYFNKISKEFTPVAKPPPVIASSRIASPTPWQIEARIRRMKKPKGRVEGDIDARLLTRFGRLLSFPLAKLFDIILAGSSWPESWKTETVTLIPKKGTPETLADLRNLSCTPFFSKLLETFILDELKSTTSLSREQFGGKKGQGVDHILIEIWDFIHRSLEDPEAAVGLMAVDFHKAFNRMCHHSCIKALRELVAEEHVLSIVQSFLQEDESEGQ